ncbi:HSP70-domain-containing protein [Conidiobolus coronatus NRRL 28638]|uniref:HSP70-domain-containing protein n=1 Tax=Conidiobolus coronatus (strain ATCC 28846 / CBS 209.66 / NRRL 28638) TaxID=796925 RepID=A0A137P507_CONC2|nr:HSP70-domain-containing protein [Conidiobolus coronatus NRRL 28638]|eukprot:KXN70097.1 HSP70-domain-containing protein [Conidiobolus coronatus NRRL 28638]
MDKETGDMWSGGQARKLAKVPPHQKKKKYTPPANDKYSIFIQSTSYNRVLVPPQRFLYERTTPSIVAFTKDGKLLVGGPAKHQHVTNPKRTFYRVKGLMRRKKSELPSAILQNISFPVTAGKNGEAIIQMDDKEFYPSKWREITSCNFQL